MALMEFREQNHVLWRGVRPAHDGTQVCKAGQQAGVGIVSIYTGHATKNLFLTFAMLSSTQSAAAAGMARMLCLPIGEAGTRNILVHLYSAEGHQVCTATFNPPLEVIANTDVEIASDQAGITVRGDIHGWIE